MPVSNTLAELNEKSISVKRARAEFKGDLKVAGHYDSREIIARTLREPELPSWLETVRLGTILRWIPYMGDSRCAVVFREAQVYDATLKKSERTYGVPDLPLNLLTFRERVTVANVLA